MNTAHPNISAPCLATAWVSKNIGRTNIEHIPLLGEKDGCAITREHGNRCNHLLARSERLEMKLDAIKQDLIRRESHGAEGMLYCIYKRVNGDSIPVYIGISHLRGRGDNRSSLWRESYKYARFGDSSGSHIWDLSTNVCQGHKKKVKSKRTWAKILFGQDANDELKIIDHLFVWCSAWIPESQSIFTDFGHTPLFVEEALLTWVMASHFGGDLCNDVRRHCR